MAGTLQLKDDDGQNNHGNPNHNNLNNTHLRHNLQPQSASNSYNPSAKQLVGIYAVAAAFIIIPVANLLKLTQTGKLSFRKLGLNSVMIGTSLLAIILHTPKNLASAILAKLRQAFTAPTQKTQANQKPNSQLQTSKSGTQLTSSDIEQIKIEPIKYEVDYQYQPDYHSETKSAFYMSVKFILSEFGVCYKDKVENAHPYRPSQVNMSNGSKQLGL
jgi:hypothetical protein